MPLRSHNVTNATALTVTPSASAAAIRDRATLEGSYVIHEGPVVVKGRFKVVDVRARAREVGWSMRRVIRGVLGRRPGLVALVPGEPGRVKRRVSRAWLVGAGWGCLTRAGESGRKRGGGHGALGGWALVR
ncbi:MAG: hypothetical protein WBP81_16435 [Solirubrobacteraceae bacterium]